ncbi:MAG: DUF433 domain-containing protein [Chloroflexi bacterium]|nr:DUF433 domain-containing protein [Chloroflexota bacterium]
MAIEIAPNIIVDTQIRFGKPAIKGTRVPVHVLVAKVAGGMTPEQVADEYGVTLEDVRAALAYAANASLRHHKNTPSLARRVISKVAPP